MSFLFEIYWESKMKKIQQYLLSALAAILVACPTPVVPPTISTFTATPGSLPIGGGEITLAWEAQNATSLTIDQNIGVVTGTQKTTTINATTVFTLTATNSGGSAQKTVFVNVAQSKPIITSFTASPASLPVGGGSSTLSWQVSGADSLSIDQAVGTVTGNSKEVNLTTTTTYILTATNNFGVTTQPLTIEVAQVVIPPLSQISGTLDPWTRGARVLKGSIYTTPNAAMTTINGTLIQTGQFEMALPDTVPNLQTPLTTGACGSKFVITPSDAKGATLNIGIETTNGKVSGFLTRANTPIPYSQSAGSKQAIYYFSDKASTLKGTCSSNGRTQTANATFKQGWNVLLVEFISSNNVRFSTDPVPADVSWHFIASGGLTITNPMPKLELGETTTLTATADDGYIFPHSELEWSSSNPDVLEIDSAGVVMAKQLGNGQITVRAKGTFLTNATISITAIGFIAYGHTYNIEDTTLGTAIRLIYSDSEVSVQEIPVTIIGPNGWNNNQPFEALYKMNGIDRATLILTETPAMDGTYTVRRSTKSVGGTTFTIDTSKKLPVAKNFTRFDTNSQYLTLYWQAVKSEPIATLEYATEIVDAVTGEIIIPKQPFDSRLSIDIDSLPLVNTSKTYKLRVYTRNAPYHYHTFDSFVGVSVASFLLDFRPTIKEVYINGGQTSGGNNVVISGSYFDSNTKVFFGSVEATNKTLTTTTSMTVVAPAGQVGTVDITLQTAQGTSSISSKTKYTYYAVTKLFSNFPKQLLKGDNGVVYFVEVDFSSSPPTNNLVQVSANAPASRLPIMPVASSADIRDLTLDSANNVWLALETKLLKVTPANEISTIDLPSGVNPAAITFGSDGNIWFSRTDSFKIGRIQPDGTNFTEFTIPTSGSFTIWNDIVKTSDGNIWFTSDYGALGRITSDGSITILPNTNLSNGRILVHDNSIWLNNGSGSISRITYDGIVTTVGYCGSSYLAIDNDNNFWCGSQPNSSIISLSKLTITAPNLNFIIQTVAMYNASDVNYSTVSDLISDSTGKIWFIIGNIVSVLTP
jgi:hypothetical protein